MLPTEDIFIYQKKTNLIAAPCAIPISYID